MDWIQEAKKEITSQKEIMSFEEYIDHFNAKPVQETRTSSMYLKSMFKYFGESKKDGFTLFNSSEENSKPVFGQKRVSEKIYQNILNFIEEGFNNKFILLVGPNGSSKSSIVKKLMEGAERYSKTPSGALYTFSWMFPVDTFVKGKLGFSIDEPANEKKKLKTFAYLEEVEVNAIINSDLKDHPLLLIPKKYRQSLIDNALKDAKEDHLKHVKMSYLYTGSLSKKNNMIYEALLKSYKGDHEEVLKHIRIERWSISRRYSDGAVTIEPQMHVDAKLQQITMDQRLANLPPSLKSLNLFSMQGETIMANRGLLEFSDLLKRPIDAFKYLLTTMETSNVNIQGILTQLDIFFIGSSNELHLDAFKQHPDYKSFKGRFNFITVPYLLNYQNEMKIYQRQIDGLTFKTTFEPHALSTLCKFAIMSRLRAPKGENYGDNQRLKDAVQKLSPLDKTEFYYYKDAPENLDIETRQILTQNFKTVREEFEADPGYEGRFGLSPRSVMKIIYKLSSEHKHVSVIHVLDYLKKFITKKTQYDFLNMPSDGQYHSPDTFVSLLLDQSLKVFDSELRDCLGMVDNRSYEEYIKTYIQNVNAITKNEKIKNEVTGKYEEPNHYMIDGFEKSIELNEDSNLFRSQLISNLGAYFLDNPGKNIIYTSVFPELVRRLKDSFKEEQNKVITVISNNLIYYETEYNKQENDKGERIKTPLSKENKELIKNVLDNLVTKYKYSHLGAIGILKNLLKSKY